MKSVRFGRICQLPRGPRRDGVFIVDQGEKPVTYRAGDIFFVPAGRSHTEEIGAPGAKIVVGPKY